MNWKKWLLVTAGLACGMVGAGAAGLHLWTAYAGDMRTVPLRSTGLGQVDVKAPAGEPSAFIVLLSDVQGTTPTLNQFADDLVSQGAAVITLSTPDLLRSLDATKTGTCHYALGLFEDLSQTAQRTLNVDTYRWPVVLGIGQGGTVAFLSEAQSPVNTAAGAVSVGFDPALRTRLPFCGDPATKAADGSFVYSPPPSLTGRWIVIPPGTGDTGLSAFAASPSLGEVRQVAGGFDDRLAAAAKASLEISKAAEETLTEQMPVVELPSDGADTLAVFYSGDGGWRDIDKKISEQLNAQGIAVVGIDSLRYFWREKTPTQIGADLDRLADDYKKRWGIRRVALVGYSMGAGVLPFAWNNLSEKTRQATSLVALLSLDPTSSFEVSISGYLGLDAPSDVAIGPAVRTMPHDKLMCFYGADEAGPEDSGCLAPEMRGASLIERPGGHHFDGDYQPIAEMIIDRLKQGHPAMELASHRYDLPDAM